MSRTAALVAYAALGAALISWSWLKWPDPLVDFGRELYVPWQLTNGKMLYRDIASLFGPLSPYVNAFWFRLFGPGLATLVACNLAIFAATLAGIYRLIRHSVDAVTAHAATVLVVLLCGFCQYTEVGNYNFVTPYAHETTHGLALAVVVLLASHHVLTRERFGWAIAAGFAFGLLTLTKPETSLACAGAVFIGSVMIRFARQWSTRLWIAVGMFGVAALVAPAGFVLYFHRYGPMSWRAACAAVASGWTIAFGTAIFSNPFYRSIAGLDRPLANAGALIVAFMTCAAYAAIAITLEVRGSNTLRWIGRGLLLIAGVVLNLWYLMPRALPLVAAASAVTLILTFRREQLSLTMWCAFATLLLGKMWLNARIYRYGFVLALPALSVVAIVALRMIPQMVAIRWTVDASRRVRLMLGGTLLIATVPYLTLSSAWYRTKVIVVGSGPDRFLATSPAAGQWQGAAVEDVAARVGRLAPPNATVAVLPEGVMINYLARRETPVPVVNFMPPELIAFGEPAIVAEFAAHSPDFIVLVDRGTTEYGYASFGADARYGRQIREWIDGHYETADCGLGFEILARTGSRRTRSCKFSHES